MALVGEGRSQTEVAGLLDVSRQSVSEWVRARRLGGDEALAAGKRGRRPGEKTALTASQQAQISKAIREKNPDQLKLPGFLWTRALVCELIDRRFGIRVAEKTAGRYLRAWGFSPQKPARRAVRNSKPIDGLLVVHMCERQPHSPDAHEGTHEAGYSPRAN